MSKTLFPRELARSWRSLGVIGFLVIAFTGTISAQTAQYTGSAACKTCHAATYERWSKTRMANVVRDPKEHPDAIIPDLSKADPAIVTFTKDAIAFVYGSKWKQRYFTKVGDDYFPSARAVGRGQSTLEPLFGPQWHRLVGASLSGRQHAAAHRPAVRRLPLGQLQHPDQDGHRMERGLRKMPRTRQPARRPAVPRQHRQSRRASGHAAATSASSATRRASRWRIRSRENITIGRSVST